MKRSGERAKISARPQYDRGDIFRNHILSVAFATNTLGQPFVAIIDCSGGIKESLGYTLCDCHENENEHDSCTSSAVSCMHFVQRRLGRGGSLLIDHFYCLPVTSIVRKVYCGWKSRAYD